VPYRRVIPRDLFNEAKLLKCLGQLALILLDYGDRYPLVLEHDDEGFLIDQNPDDGNLFCTSLRLYHTSGQEIALSSEYNSKEPYPLCFEYDDLYGPVFTDDGKFDQEFLDAMGVSNQS
jgi:hypothetical protein